MKKILIILSVLFVTNNLIADEAMEIIKKVQSNLNSIKDFEANINIKVDISYVNAPEMKGKIYYKYPNKTKVDIDGFGILPKQGTGNFIGELLENKNQNFILSGEEKINNITYKIIKVIPLDLNSDIVISTLWINPANSTVYKSEITTKKSGTYLAEIEYILIDKKYWLPEKTIVKINVPSFTLPKSLSGDSRTQNKTKDENVQGKVIINYSNYKVNKELSDSIFEKKNKKE